jgi:small subunit ribosomal protein S1
MDRQPEQANWTTLLENEFDYTRPRRRQILEATILTVDENQVLVDLGGKRDGVVTERDLDLLTDEYRASLCVGKRVPVYILDASDGYDAVIVSLNKGLAYQDWLHAERLLESEETCEAQVSATNKGGLVVQFGRLRGFAPNSHLTSIPRGMRGERLREAKEDLIGKTLSLAVIEVDRRRQRLILSERAAQRLLRARLLEELSAGQIRTGIVRNLVSYGAFVDLGGIDGLIHVSELDWGHVKHPRDVLEVGAEIQVYVLNVDREKERVGLSRKRLLPDPWPLVTEGLRQGDVIEGTVSSIAKFGAFVSVGEGVDGLVHVSEMPNGSETLSALEQGARVQVRVLKLDPWKRRISLSLNTGAYAAPMGTPTDAPVGTPVGAPVGAEWDAAAGDLPETDSLVGMSADPSLNEVWYRQSVV